VGGRGIPSVIAKQQKRKETHGPPLLFAVFTRRIVDLNSQSI